MDLICSHQTIWALDNGAETETAQKISRRTSLTGQILLRFLSEVESHHYFSQTLSGSMMSTNRVLSQQFEQRANFQWETLQFLLAQWQLWQRIFPLPSRRAQVMNRLLWWQSASLLWTIWRREDLVGKIHSSQVLICAYKANRNIVTSFKQSAADAVCIGLVQLRRWILIYVTGWDKVCGTR